MYQKLPQNPLSFYGEKKFKLGEGTYGTVYKYRKGPLKTDPEEYAVKKYIGLETSSIREISALLSVPKTPYVMPIIDVSVDDNYEVINMVMLLGNASLNKITSKNKEEPLKLVKDPSEDGFKRYLWQIATGLAELHRVDIWHRDIKPQNIIYFPYTDDLAIADLGTARTRSCPSKNMFYTKEVYTLYYRAPEILLGYNQRDLPADIWALGCVFYEMLTGEVLFRGDSGIDQTFRIFRTMGTPAFDDIFFNSLTGWDIKFPRWREGLLPKLLNTESNKLYQNPKLNNLITKMLKMNPKDRPTIFEILNDEYFDSVIKDRIIKPLNCWELSQLTVIEPRFNPEFKNRNDYIDTLIKCGDNYDMKYETIFNAIFIMDRLSNQGLIGRDIIYISLYISSLYLERSPVEMMDMFCYAEEFDDIGDEEWHKKIDEKNAIKALQKLDWSLNHPTAYEMLLILLDINEMNDIVDKIMMQEVKTLEYFKHPAIFAQELLDKYKDKLKA